ncbi:MAG: hypothetical protein K6G03_08850, partial [Lachnospiraceae bacterium]|nr:hypothetical protein [Lachnospiraceae bacterium]
MYEVSGLVRDLSVGYYPAQVLVIILLSTAGLLYSKAGGLKNEWAYLYAFPVGLAFYSVSGYLLLCLGIPFNTVSITVIMTVTAVLSVYICKKNSLVDINIERRSLLVFFLLITAGAMLFSANILSVLVDNDTFYYFSTFPEAIVHEGRYIKYFDTFLTDSAPIGSIIYTLPYLYGFSETFGIQYMLDLNFIVIFAYSLKNALSGSYSARGAWIIGITASVFMLTSSAYLTTAKWVMAGVYFMSYYFITMILAYESAKVEKKPYVVLM